MAQTFLSINPETGEPTKDHEFVNSWKWDLPQRKEFLSENEQRKATCQQLRIPEDTPWEAIQKIKRLDREYRRYESSYEKELRCNSEYLHVLEETSFEIKHLEAKIKDLQRQNKKFLKEIKPYLTHKEDCLVTMMNIVGRAKIKSKCNCGLSEILKQVS